jgi:hypothetical protein
MELQAIYQIELGEQKSLYELILNRIKKAEKEIAKFIGVDYLTWELKVKLAGLKP